MITVLLITIYFVVCAHHTNLLCDVDVLNDSHLVIMSHLYYICIKKQNLVNLLKKKSHDFILPGLKFLSQSIKKFLILSEMIAESAIQLTEFDKNIKKLKV